jgi:putative membrane protein
MMSMSASAWYSVHARWTPAWGLTPLEDQQLAGLIMWVPCAMIYLAAVVPTALRSLSERSPAKALATSG